MSDYNGYDFSANDPIAAQFGTPSPARAVSPDAYIPPQTTGGWAAPFVQPTGYSGGRSAVAAVPLLRPPSAAPAFGDRLSAYIAKGPPPWVGWVVAILSILNGVRTLLAENKASKKRRDRERERD